MKKTKEFRRCVFELELEIFKGKNSGEKRKKRRRNRRK